MNTKTTNTTTNISLLYTNLHKDVIQKIVEYAWTSNTHQTLVLVCKRFHAWITSNEFFLKMYSFPLSETPLSLSEKIPQSLAQPIPCLRYLQLLLKHYNTLGKPRVREIVCKHVLSRNTKLIITESPLSWSTKMLSCLWRWCYEKVQPFPCASKDTTIITLSKLERIHKYMYTSMMTRIPTTAWYVLSLHLDAWYDCNVEVTSACPQEYLDNVKLRLLEFTPMAMIVFCIERARNDNCEHATNEAVQFWNKLTHAIGSDVESCEHVMNLVEPMYITPLLLQQDIVCRDAFVTKFLPIMSIESCLNVTKLYGARIDHNRDRLRLFANALVDKVTTNTTNTTNTTATPSEDVIAWFNMWYNMETGYIDDVDIVKNRISKVDDNKLAAALTCSLDNYTMHLELAEKYIRVMGRRVCYEFGILPTVSVILECETLQETLKLLGMVTDNTKMCLDAIKKLIYHNLWQNRTREDVTTTITLMSTIPLVDGDDYVEVLEMLFKEDDEIKPYQLSITHDSLTNELYQAYMIGKEREYVIDSNEAIYNLYNNSTTLQTIRTQEFACGVAYVVAEWPDCLDKYRFLYDTLVHSCIDSVSNESERSDEIHITLHELLGVLRSHTTITIPVDIQHCARCSSIMKTS